MCFLDEQKVGSTMMSAVADGDLGLFQAVGVLGPFGGWHEHLTLRPGDSPASRSETRRRPGQARVAVPAWTITTRVTGGY